MTDERGNMMAVGGPPAANRLSTRSGVITPFMVMEILEAAKELEAAGEDVVHLEIGEPDFETPEVVRLAGARALAAGNTHYTHSLGRLDLREEIAAHYSRYYDVNVWPDRIVVTAGTSTALWLALAALIDPGDEVILGDPCYACYPNFVRFFGGVPRFVRLDPNDGYQFPLDSVQLLIGPRTRAIVVNSPSNPTGTLLSDATQAGLAVTGVPVISDEIYHQLVYQGRERTMLEFSSDAIVLNGFSKAYAMTGWRLGYLILPESLVRPIQTMVQNFFISAADFPQIAAISALRDAGPDVLRMREEYDSRRKVIVSGLRRLGFGVSSEPTGAFYVLADARRWSHDSREFAYRMLREAKVAATPGVDFGAASEGFIRFCYAASLERIREALVRLERFLD